MATCTVAAVDRDVFFLSQETQAAITSSSIGTVPVLYNCYSVCVTIYKSCCSYTVCSRVVHQRKLPNKRQIFRLEFWHVFSYKHCSMGPSAQTISTPEHGSAVWDLCLRVVGAYVNQHHSNKNSPICQHLHAVCQPCHKATKISAQNGDCGIESTA